mmetsp:Transcript_11909/g.33555  ORF Transcript_11909/g.33555 Transcript_11909/m.33555 type:complete len:188 (+) Transcript_11909:415-978(+)
MAGAERPRRLLSYLAIFGAGCLLLACGSLMRGHQHANTHHDSMSSKEKDRMKEDFFSATVRVKDTLARLDSLEQQVADVIEHKIAGIADTLHSSNLILDAPKHAPSAVRAAGSRGQRESASRALPVAALPSPTKGTASLPPPALAHVAVASHAGPGEAQQAVVSAGDPEGHREEDTEEEEGEEEKQQ